MKKSRVILTGAVALTLLIAVTILTATGGGEAPTSPTALEGKWAAIMAATPTPSPSPTAVPTPTPEDPATPEPTLIPSWTYTPTPEPGVTAAGGTNTSSSTTPRAPTAPQMTPTPVSVPIPLPIPTSVPTPAPTATPVPTSTPSPTPIPTPTPAPFFHVGDLNTWGHFNGSGANGWVRITLHNAEHGKVVYTYVYAAFFLDGVRVTGDAHVTGGGYNINGIVWYKQNDFGASVRHFPPGVLTYCVTNLREYDSTYPHDAPRDYDPTQNHDPDLDNGGTDHNMMSDGTCIEVMQ